MSVSRRPVPEASSIARPALWPVLCISFALAACSGDLSAQGSRPQAQSGVPTSVPTVPAVETAVRALPNLSPLVEK